MHINCNQYSSANQAKSQPLHQLSCASKKYSYNLVKANICTITVCKCCMDCYKCRSPVCTKQSFIIKHTHWAYCSTTEAAHSFYPWNCQISSTNSFNILCSAKSLHGWWHCSGKFLSGNRLPPQCFPSFLSHTPSPLLPLPPTLSFPLPPSPLALPLPGKRGIQGSSPVKILKF